jgi:cytochrome c553
MTLGVLDLAVISFVSLILVSNTSAGMIDKEGMDEWEVCAMCHSLDGVSRMPKFPKLAGQKSSYISKQFLDFYHGHRNNDGGQMEAISTEVDLTQLDDIANYFSQLPPPTAADLESDPDSIARFTLGENLFYKGQDNIVACASCHDRKGYSERNKIPLYLLGSDTLVPRLFGQHEEYLVKQLEDFRDSYRSNDLSGSMHKIAAGLDAESIASVSFYLAREQPYKEAE